MFIIFDKNISLEEVAILMKVRVKAEEGRQEDGSSINSDLEQN